jgi:hypothetical protein
VNPVANRRKWDVGNVYGVIERMDDRAIVCNGKFTAQVWVTPDCNLDGIASTQSQRCVGVLRNGC